MSKTCKTVDQEHYNLPYPQKNSTDKYPKDKSKDLYRIEKLWTKLQELETFYQHHKIRLGIYEKELQCLKF